jgi:large subunit ribosomal protein L3
MTQVFSEDDRVIPVTVIQLGPCVVTQIKTVAKEGYDAVQLGFGSIKPKRVNKPMQGHFDAAGVEPSRVLREVHVDDSSSYRLGQKVTVEQFVEVKKVDVSGISKGKGFAGVMKRHNFRGGPGGHGAHFHRAPGSIGQCATPSRVFKGLRLPGHMGVDKVTVRNLEVVSVDVEKNLLLVKGAVPGGKGALVSVRSA